MFEFEAQIYLVDQINAIVDVPAHITERMKPYKGTIYVEGFVNETPFTKHLVPTKGGPYKLYINLVTQSAAKVGPGDVVSIKLAQVEPPAKTTFNMPAKLAERMDREGLMEQFAKISPGRQQAIFSYLSGLKNPEILEKHIGHIISELLSGNTRFIVPAKPNKGD